MNRRFYREGLEWAVSGMTLMTNSTTSGSLEINKIPDTWVSSQAWKKGFSIWRKQIRESMEELGDEFEGRFADFKVYMDAYHESQGVANNLRPIDADNDLYSEGEWDMSQIVIAASDSSSVTEFDLIWTGDNVASAKSLIQGYADSRALPYEQDPNVPTAASLNWMTAVFNEGTLVDNAVVNNIESQNDQAPYPYEGDGVNTVTMYPGGANQAAGLEPHDLTYVTATTVGGKSFIRGGAFKGGLIRVNAANLVDSVPEQIYAVLQVHLVPGSHRGYLCRKLQDV